MRFLPPTLLVVLTGLRFWATATMPLTPDEAFQWMCANQLDWAFFDGPGGTACLGKIGFLALGDAPLGLRLAFPLFAALATIGAFLVGRSLFGRAGGWWAAAGLNALPIFNIAAVQASPWVPLTATLLLAAWSGIEAIQNGSLLRWLAAGAFAALAAQFSYLALLFLPGVLIACALSTHRRRHFRSPGLYLATLVALAGLVPAIAWNHANGWPVLALETARTLVSPKWSAIPAGLWDTLSALSVAGAFLVLLVAGVAAAGARAHARPKLLAGLAAPFVAFWLYMLWHGGNTQPAALLAAGTVLAGAGCVTARPAVLLLCGLAGISAGFSAAAIGQSARANAVPWTDIARNVDALLVKEQSSRTQALFLVAEDPELTAMLNYHLPRIAPGQPREIFLRESQDLSNQFGLWPRYDDFIETDTAPDEFFQQHKARNPYLGRSAIYLTDELPEDLPQTITSGFVSTIPLATMQSGERILRAYLCEEYQTVPL